MRPRSHLLDVVVAVLAVPFTIWWFVPGKVADLAEDPESRAHRALVAQRAAEPQSLRGTVVDETGTPVADAWIARFEYDKAVTLATTFADGRFTVDRQSGFGIDRGSRTEVFAFHPQFDVAHEWLPWGRDDLRLVLRPLVPIEVRVVDENGLAVRATGATCHWDPVVVPDTYTWLGANGDVLRGSAFRGTNYLSIEFADGVPVAREAIERRAITVVEPGPVQVTVVAATMLPREVRVLAPDGTPVADAWVELIDARGGGVTPYDRTVGNADGPVQVSRATTDALGTARPLGPVGRPLVVRARCGGFAPGLVAEVRVPGSQTVVVRLGRCASGRGRVLVDPQIAARIATGHCELLFTYFEPRDLWGCVVAADGSFKFDGVHPRHWDGQLWGHRSRREVSEDCGVSLDLKEGDNPPLVFDLRECARTEVCLRVLFDGQAASYARVDFHAATSHDYRAEADCDEEGRCSTRLRPGTYWVRVWPGMNAWSGDDAGCALLSVAGDRFARDLALGIGGMAVTLVDAKGGPLRGQRCSTDWTFAPGRRPEWTITDADGLLRRQCPAGEWAVSVGPHPRRLLGTVTVRGGETTKATFVVPDDVPR